MQYVNVVINSNLLHVDLTFWISVSCVRPKRYSRNQCNTLSSVPIISVGRDWVGKLNGCFWQVNILSSGYLYWVQWTKCTSIAYCNWYNSFAVHCVKSSRTCGQPEFAGVRTFAIKICHYCLGWLSFCSSNGIIGAYECIHYCAFAICIVIFSGVLSRTCLRFLLKLCTASAESLSLISASLWPRKTLQSRLPLSFWTSF